MFDFGELKKKVGEVEEWLKREMSSIRTGRANATILDNVKVEAYGAKMSIQELANVSVADSRSLVIAPWDANIAKDIEKAILTSNLGLSVNIGDQGIRIIFPELTSERREGLLKLAKQKLEEARISLRGLRDKTWDEIQKKEKDKEISEDNRFRLKDEMQKIVNGANEKLGEDYERKEKEIKS